MYNPLLAVSVQLSDAAEGEGGFVVIRGSHKVRSSSPSPPAACGAPARRHFEQ